PTDDDTETPVPDRRVLGQVASALAVLAAALIATYVVEPLSFARPWRPGDPIPFWNLLGRPFEADEPAPADEALARLAAEVLEADEPVPDATRPPPLPPGEPWRPRPEDLEPAPQPLELFEGHELDGFFEALAAVDDGQDRVVRVVHFGDSAIGVDGIPGAIRRRMQARFGDAGHGFHAIAPPNTSYRHREVRFRHNGLWRICFIIHKCLPDGHYGLAGVAGRSAGGAESSFAPDPKRSSGKVARFTVHYAGRPGGGDLRLRVDGGDPVVLSTEAPSLEDRFHTIDVDDAPHELELRAVGGGRVRVYGVALDRPGPGIGWDGLALVGAFTNRLLEFDRAHLARQLEARGANLVVLTFGGNDLVRSIAMDRYEAEMRQVLAHLRGARPSMACLVMAPLDHGMRQGHRIVSVPKVRPMVEAQRRAARAEGCAFFDTVAAMGGDRAAEKWYRHRPRLLSGDLAHATPAGQRLLGELLYRAIVAAYVDFRRRSPSPGRPRAEDAPSPPTSGSSPRSGTSTEAAFDPASPKTGSGPGVP
ncbi:MAG: hypothetical protein D6705_05515, partial [Deltaproteobacteria bacterium]